MNANAMDSTMRRRAARALVAALACTLLAVAGASFLVAAIAVYPIERAMRRRAGRGAP